MSHHITSHFELLADIMSGCEDACCAPKKKAPAAPPARNYGADDSDTEEDSLLEPRSVPVWTLAWLAVEAGIVVSASSSELGGGSTVTGVALAAGLCVLHVIVWTMLSGGVDSMREIIEASTQPTLPESVVGNGRGKAMLVVGAYSGLGRAVSKLAKSRAGYNVVRADLRLHGHEFVDFCDVESIKEFAQQFEGSKFDDVVLCVGAVDDRAVPLHGHFTCDTVLPRMAWVNFLGHAVLMQELERVGCQVGRVVVVSSGAYARGSQNESFFPREWDGLGALAAYAQSKFILTAWAEWQRRVRPSREISVLNPGPMRTSIGDRGVPAFLWPFYGTMLEILFPRPDRAAQAVLHLCDPSTSPSVSYMHIRKKEQLNSAVRSESCQAWAVDNIGKALEAVGYKFDGGISASDPCEIKAMKLSGDQDREKEEKAGSEKRRDAQKEQKAPARKGQTKKKDEVQEKQDETETRSASAEPAPTKEALADASLTEEKEKEFGDPDIFSAPGPLPIQPQKPPTAEQQMAELKAHIDAFAGPFNLKVTEEAKLKLVQIVFATIAALNHPKGKQIIGPILAQLKIDNLLHILSHVVATHVKLKNPDMKKPGPASEPLDLGAVYKVMHLRPDIRHLAMCSGALKESEMPKRFPVGTYVKVQFNSDWKDGVIIKHNYHEKAWPPERIAAYQIRLLENDSLIFCPLDVDHAIKKHPEQKQAKTKDKHAKK